MLVLDQTQFLRVRCSRFLEGLNRFKVKFWLTNLSLKFGLAYLKEFEVHYPIVHTQHYHVHQTI